MVLQFGYIIIIDLIMGLPYNKDKYNYIIMVTDWYMKKVMIISGKNIWGVSEWGVILINVIIDWGLLRAVIINRDLRFINKLW